MKDGGSAFPHLAWERTNCDEIAHYTSGGASLRDYFAIHVLTGLLAGQHGIPVPKDEGIRIYDYLSIIAFNYADAMIAAREEHA